MTIHRFECLACHGVYTDRCGDGAIYFHVCPPLVDRKTRAERVRDGHRDENVEEGRDADAGGIRSAGAGVKCLSNPKLREPAWITERRKRLAKERND